MEVKLNHVTYSPKKAEILSDINMEFSNKNITAIVGKSGSGKTVILELIDALIIPTTGEILVNNKAKESIKNLRNNIGYLFECPEEQFFGKTVKEELDFVLMNIKDPKEKEKRIKASLFLTELDEEILSKSPFELSNGEQRKLSLLIILVKDPEILILDEPFSGLDPKNKKVIIKILKLLKKNYNKTIIIASKDTDSVLKVADYIYVIDNKKVRLEGTKYEVFKEENKLNRYGIKVPDLVKFANLVFKEKNIKIGYRDEINDLIKDIYRYVK
jgi:ABC-type cobalt transport system, ATPase component